MPSEEIDAIREGSIALARKDYEAAASCFSDARRVAPANHHAVAGLLQVLWQTARYSELDAVLEDAAQLHCHAGLVARMRAQRAAEDRDWTGAEAQWRKALDTDWTDRTAHRGLTLALMEQKRFEEGEAQALRAIANAPDIADPYCVHAQVATQRFDYEEAAKRWAEVESRFPGHPFAERMRQNNLKHIAAYLLPEVSAADDVPLAAETDPGTAWTLDRADPEAVATLLKQFENVGRNCEFGLVQRHFGAEPLGLLRWAGTAPEALVAALQGRFSGIGEAAQTRLDVVSTGEYVLRDTKYGFGAHTSIKQHEAAADQLYPKLLRRQKFLAGKLLEDLGTGRKIFVYARPDGGDLPVDAIDQALQAFGPNRLLCVVRTDNPAEHGTVRPISDRLAMGYLDRAGLSGSSWDISFEMWLDICEAAYRHLAKAAVTVSP